MYKFKIKIKYAIFAVLVLQLVACSDESTKNLTLSPTSAVLHREQTQNISVISSNGTVTWETSNDFVAEVVDGKVTANHIGNAIIKASDGKATGTCNITVVAQYSLYDEPLTTWGTTKQTLKNALGTPYYEEENGISYLIDESRGIIVIYMFEHGMLSSAGVMLNTIKNIGIIGDFLLERYQPYAIQDNTVIYGNAMILTDASLIVAADFQTYSYIQVIYMPNTATRNIAKKVKVVQNTSFNEFMNRMNSIQH